MIRLLIPRVMPILVAVAALLLLGQWVGHSWRTVPVQPRVPGTDRATVTPLPKIDLAGTFTRGDGAPARLPGVWPGFRGPHLDNISPETTPLARAWAAAGPPALWSVDCGEGYAGPAVRNGRVYLLDYDQTARADALRCLSLDDGREIWRRAYHVEVKRNHGMSRTVPAVTDKYVVALGPKCQVICLNAVNGDFLWGIDLVRAYHATVPAWYAGQCPLIEDDTVILAPGGDALLMAVDCATGQVRWKTPNPRGWTMTHSSITPLTVAGRRMYVYCASGGVVGVDATDGRLLWETSDWKISIANVPTPVPVGDGRLFLCGGYGAGAMLLRVEPAGKGFAVRTLFRCPPATFGSDQQTPILYRDHLYGVIPGGELVCLDLNGKQVWTSGTVRFGLCAYLLADGRLYVLNEQGELTLVEATPTRYTPLAHAKVLSGIEPWGPMALVDGRLFVRDLTRMVCLDVR